METTTTEADDATDELTIDDLEPGMTVIRQDFSASAGPEAIKTEFQEVVELPFGITDICLADGSNLWSIEDFSGDDQCLWLSEDEVPDAFEIREAN